MIGWIVIIVIILFFKKFNNYLRSVILALRLPGPPALPVFGNVLTILDGQELIARSNEVTKYQPICRLWCFVLPMFVIFDPEHVKIIASNTKVSDKNFLYRIVNGFIGDGLITSTGNKWKTHRKHIQPFFQSNFLETYCDDFTRIARESVQTLQGKKSVKMTSFVNTCILKILHKIVLDVDLKSELDTPFRKSELFLIKRLLQPWLLLDNIFKRSAMFKYEAEHTGDLHAYVEKILQQRPNQKSCLLDKIMSLIQKGFTKEDVVNETVTFLLAGHDSVGSAIVFSLYNLAQHQEVQRRVHEEVNKEECVSNMPYLEQCIKESLRLYPSIPLVGRELLCDVTLGEYTLQKGANLLISPLATHRLPHLYPNPLQYDPERFSLENSKKLHPYGYLPFSVGPRNCIGQKFALLEMKTVISMILREFRISLRKEELCVGFKLTLRTSGGMWMNLEKWE